MSRDINLLHPKLRAIIPRIIAECSAQGLPVLITETWRTRAEQDALYAQGRSVSGPIVTNVRYPDSLHCWGVAFDFCRNVRRMEYDDRDGFFRRVAEIAKPYGLWWGGDWKNFVDKPHLQLLEFSSVEVLKTLYGTPEEFRATWKETEGKTVENVERFATIADLPPRMEYAVEPLRELMVVGALVGDGNPIYSQRRLDMTEGEIRMITIMKRYIDARGK